MTYLKKDMVGTFRYILTVDDAIIDAVPDNESVEYLHGYDNLVPGLEKALEGKKADDKFKVTILPAEGYGEYDETLVQEMLLDDIEDGDQLEEGMIIELFGVDEDGDDVVYEALVTKITDKAVTLDMNSELAGKVLNYDVEVVTVRSSTDLEREAGLPASMINEIDNLLQDMFEVLSEADD